MPDGTSSHSIAAGTQLRAATIIGHLFEAEDESQEWPDLHDAIRDARRTYQQTGKTPDFDALAGIISKFRRQIL